MNIVYDLGKCPASWDFLQFLINYKLAMAAQGIAKFNVCFVPGPSEGFRSDSVARPTEARKAILNNVMRPALRLVGAEEVEYGEELPLHYLTRYAVQWAKNGVTIPHFDIPQEFTDEVERDYGKRKPLLITLREADYYPLRNSKLRDWKKFARRCGEDVIFVRDTAKADEPIEGYETCPRAAKDFLYRAALMRKAKCNMLMEAGPRMLALYSPTPWITFGGIRPDMPDWSPGRPDWWAKQIGVPMGSQFPWATKTQRIFWGDDSLENLEMAWRQMSSSVQGHRRRPIGKMWKAQFEEIRRQSQKYADIQMRIDTIEMYEGADDKPADMIVACNILEHLADPDKALQEINRLALKQILITIVPDAIRDEKAWKKIIENRLTINDWMVDPTSGTVACYAFSGMRVEGVKVVGAMSDEDRWDHVENALAKVKKRIKLVPPHDRRAIIACYGPSLKACWPKLKQEQEETGAVVVSVSGAHDFLIEHGITPDYHVECDPRPHKTNNIGLPKLATEYLLASCCHPSLFEKLAGFTISLWHVAAGTHLLRLVNEKHESTETTVSGGGSVGIRAIPLMHRLGYRDFSIYGMDCSFAEMKEGDSFDPAEVQKWTGDQWAGKHFGKRQMIETAKVGERYFYVSPILVVYAGHFFDVMQRLPGTTYRVYGDGMLQAMCKLYTKHTQLMEVAA